MKSKKRPRELRESEAAAIVTAFDDAPDDRYLVTDTTTLAELRSAAAAQREAGGRIEAAAVAAHRAGLSWGVIGYSWVSPAKSRASASSGLSIAARRGLPARQGGPWCLDGCAYL